MSAQLDLSSQTFLRVSEDSRTVGPTPSYYPQENKEQEKVSVNPGTMTRELTFSLASTLSVIFEVRDSLFHIPFNTESRCSEIPFNWKKNN